MSVYLRLLAGIAALTAGIAAAVFVLLLLHSTIA
jgi:hypothetical protein